ncbi:hypothetical protein OH77DRAFT_310623 [Trametes cingulata]|nr:hypothetical protein OH77DRAFT_310623 [Trametes cingulata]
MSQHTGSPSSCGSQSSMATPHTAISPSEANDTLDSGCATAMSGTGDLALLEATLQREDPSFAFKDHLEALRSKIVTLQLELTILKAQRATDRSKLEQYERELVGLRASTQELCLHLGRIGRILDDLEASRSSMRELSANASAPDYREPVFMVRLGIRPLLTRIVHAHSRSAVSSLVILNDALENDFVASELEPTRLIIDRLRHLGSSELYDIPCERMRMARFWAVLFCGPFG